MVKNYSNPQDKKLSLFSGKKTALKGKSLLTGELLLQSCEMILNLYA